MSQSLKVGDLVRKRAGYEYPGIIVSVFTTRAGAVRYVVEADHPGFVGMLHIFNETSWSLGPNVMALVGSYGSGATIISRWKCLLWGDRRQGPVRKMRGLIAGVMQSAVKLASR